MLVMMGDVDYGDGVDDVSYDDDGDGGDDTTTTTTTSTVQATLQDVYYPWLIKSLSIMISM